MELAGNHACRSIQPGNDALSAIQTSASQCLSSFSSSVCVAYSMRRLPRQVHPVQEHQQLYNRKSLRHIMPPESQYIGLCPVHLCALCNSIEYTYLEIPKSPWNDRRAFIANTLRTLHVLLSALASPTSAAYSSLYIGAPTQTSGDSTG